MKNIHDIRQKLIDIRVKRKFATWLDEIPESKQLMPGIEEMLLEGIDSILEKISNHLDTKKPSKSGITAIIERSFFKLQSKGIGYEGQHCLTEVLTRILNASIDGFFTKRLNVKSKEFMELPDWDPSQE